MTEPTLAETLTGFSARVFLLSAAVALAFALLRRLRPASRPLPALRFACWCALPCLAWAAANLIRRLTGCGFNHPLTYPFYANPYCPGGTGLPDAIRHAVSRPGTLPWLGVAAAAGAAIVVVAALSLRAGTRRAVCAALAALLAAGFVFLLAVACIPDGMYDHPERGARSSLVSAWTDEGSTMLYAVPCMRLGSKRYMWEYRLLQQRLKRNFVIHAVSHPPLGSLVVRWIGLCAGVRVDDPDSISETGQQMRYAIGQTVVSTLNLVLVFAFAAALFGRRAGVLAAALWCVSPTVSSYASFAPDMNYAVLFHLVLLLAWKISDEPDLRKSLLRWAFPLGLALGVLAMMTYSWCIVAAFAAAFAAWDGLARRRPIRDVAARVAIPVAAFAAVALFIVVRYRVDYVSNYLCSARFVSWYYRHDGLVEKAVALFGGQVEWLFLAGPAACSCFFLSLGKVRADPEGGAARIRFAAALAAVYALPILFGPPALKHEVARCWVWLLPVPMAFAARFLAGRGSVAACAGVAAASAVFSVLLNCFCSFAA